MKYGKAVNGISALGSTLVIKSIDLQNTLETEYMGNDSQSYVEVLSLGLFYQTLTKCRWVDWKQTVMQAVKPCFM